MTPPPAVGVRSRWPGGARPARRLAGLPALLLAVLAALALLARGAGRPGGRGRAPLAPAALGLLGRAAAARPRLPARRDAAALLGVAGVAGAAGAQAVGSGADVPGVGGSRVRVGFARGDTELAHALDGLRFGAKWPYNARDFRRLDEGDDAAFYAEPKLVKHVDDASLAALTSYYEAVFPRDRPFAALDICSSWVSHYPSTPRPTRLAITGMNEEELKRNSQATEYAVRDLNKDPRLPFGDQEFDVVTNTVSVDYLTQPLDVFKEVSRVLVPGGLASVAFSNRVFLAKVVAAWSREDASGHAELIADYFHFAGGFKDIGIVDVSPKGSDPMTVVYALKA